MFSSLCFSLLISIPARYVFKSSQGLGGPSLPPGNKDLVTVSSTERVREARNACKAQCLSVPAIDPTPEAPTA